MGSHNARAEVSCGRRARGAPCSAQEHSTRKRGRRMAEWPCTPRGDELSPNANCAGSHVSNALIGTSRPPFKSLAVKRPAASALTLASGEVSY